MNRGLGLVLRMPQEEGYIEGDVTMEKYGSAACVCLAFGGLFDTKEPPLCHAYCSFLHPLGDGNRHAQSRGVVKGKEVSVLC